MSGSLSGAGGLYEPAGVLSHPPPSFRVRVDAVEEAEPVADRLGRLVLSLPGGDEGVNELGGDRVKCPVPEEPTRLWCPRRAALSAARPRVRRLEVVVAGLAQGEALEGCCAMLAFDESLECTVGLRASQPAA